MSLLLGFQPVSPGRQILVNNMIMPVFKTFFSSLYTKTLTYARNALYWDLSYSLFEAGETWVNLPDLALFPLNQLLNDLREQLQVYVLSQLRVSSRKQAFTSMRTSQSFTYLFLSFNDMRELSVGDSRVQLALHQGRSLVVFDVSQVSTLRHFDVFGKALGEKNKLLDGRVGGREQDVANAMVEPAVPAS